MNALDNQLEQKNEQEDSVQSWIDITQKNAIRMSQDEEYRQEVAAKATNWGKDISAASAIRVRRMKSPHLEIK